MILKLRILVSESSDPMCPTKLKNVVTLEASSNPDDWGVCSKFCNLKHYKSNEEIYDQVLKKSFFSGFYFLSERWLMRKIKSWTDFV